MAKKEKGEVTELDLLQKEINSFIKTNSKIEVESLEDHDFFPDFLDTGNFALNWAISGKFKGGSQGLVSAVSDTGKNSEDQHNCNSAFRTLRWVLPGPQICRANTRCYAGRRSPPQLAARWAT